MATVAQDTRYAQDIRFTQSADGARLAYAVHGAGTPLVQAAHCSCVLPSGNSREVVIERQ